jgi:lipoprotein-releasing system permease protein
MPFNKAQVYLNKVSGADVLEIFVSNPDQIDKTILELRELANPGSLFWTWKDRSGVFLNALEVEDNVMFVILSILVLIASLNIVSGLIMLVKNKSKDIGILRTIGLSEASVLRIFFLCGSMIGVVGTICGVFFGCLFVMYIDQIFTLISSLRGAEVWDPSVRYLSKLPARLEIKDVVGAIFLSISLSFIVTYFPARRAARLNPVEALRNE